MLTRLKAQILTDAELRRRIQNVLFVVPLILIIASLFVGLESVLMGRPSAKVASVMIQNALAVMLASLWLGFQYVGSSRSSQFVVNWKTVLISAELGVVVFAIIYALLEPEYLRVFSSLRGIGDFTPLMDSTRRALLGGLDGLLLGGFAGMFIGDLDRRATQPTWTGFRLYLLLFIILIVFFMLYALLQYAFGAAGTILSIILLGILWWALKAKNQSR